MFNCAFQRIEDTLFLDIISCMMTGLAICFSNRFFSNPLLLLVRFLLQTHGRNLAVLGAYSLFSSENLPNIFIVQLFLVKILYCSQLPRNPVRWLLPILPRSALPFHYISAIIRILPLTIAINVPSRPLNNIELSWINIISNIPAISHIALPDS